MADTKISALNDSSLLTGSEFIPIVQPPNNPKGNKKVTIDDLMEKAPVQSVNGLTGAVIITAASLGAITSGDNISVLTNDVGYINATTKAQFNSILVDGDFVFTSDIIAISKGGTGLTTLGTANQILRVNAGGTALEYYTPGSSMVYPSAGIALSTGSAWGTSITDNSANWNTAFGWGNHAGLYRPIGYVPSWGEITSKPTTIAGYGITDFNSLGDARWWKLSGTNTSTSQTYGNGLTFGSAFATERTQLQFSSATFAQLVYNNSGGVGVSYFTVGSSNSVMNFGASGSDKNLVFSSTAMRVRDAGSIEGFYYDADYSSNGITNRGNRWIPDWGAVNTAINANKATDLGTINNTLFPSIQSLFSRRNVTGTDSLVQTDNGKTIYFNSATPFNFTVDSMTINSQVSFINIGSADVTFVNGSGVTIDASSFTLAGGGNYTAALIFNTATAPILLLGSSSSGFPDPMTTRGDIIVRDASNVTARLGIGSDSYVLTSDGTDVLWATPNLTGPLVTTANSLSTTFNIHDFTDFPNSSMITIELELNFIQTSGTVGSSSIYYKISRTFRRTSGGTVSAVAATTTLVSVNDTGDTFSTAPTINVGGSSLDCSYTLTSTKTFNIKYYMKKIISN